MVVTSCVKCNRRTKGDGLCHVCGSYKVIDKPFTLPDAIEWVGKRALSYEHVVIGTAGKKRAQLKQSVILRKIAAWLKELDMNVIKCDLCECFVHYCEVCGKPSFCKSCESKMAPHEEAVRKEREEVILAFREEICGNQVDKSVDKKTKR